MGGGSGGCGEMLSVIVMPIRVGYRQEWGLQCFSFGAHTGGWAQYDGTFTQGHYPQTEVWDEYVVRSAYVADLEEFAREQGWKLVKKISARH